MPLSQAGRLAVHVPFAILAVAAQAQDMKMGQLQKCADGHVAMKVNQCTSGNPVLCDVQLFKDGVQGPAARLSQAETADLMRMCQNAGANPQGNAPSPGVADANGFKVGDTVSISTAFGWQPAKILKANGDNYYVHAQSGADVTKTYPAELRRIGPMTDVDRARGLYELHEKVQVNVEGRWVDGEVVVEMGPEYQVNLVDGRSAWARPQQMRRVAAPAKPSAPVAGQPPKPGMVSCAGKLEGRYSSSQVGAFTIVFKSGKAKTKMYGTDDDEFECWISGTQVLLHKPGVEPDVPLEVNDDGTIDTPMGEIKKKGS